MADLVKLFDKTHPFISEPGEWLTVGAGISGADLSRFGLDGRTNVYHEDGRIRVDGFMSVISGEGKNFVTGYSLTPTDHPSLLDYGQESPEVGGIRGELMWMDDRLIIAFASGDGSLQGNELFTRLGENRYTVVGSVSRSGSFVTVWKVDLVRKASGS